MTSNGKTISDRRKDSRTRSATKRITDAIATIIQSGLNSSNAMKLLGSGVTGKARVMIRSSAHVKRLSFIP